MKEIRMVPFNPELKPGDSFTLEEAQQACGAEALVLIKKRIGPVSTRCAYRRFFSGGDNSNDKCEVHRPEGCPWVERHKETSKEVLRQLLGQVTFEFDSKWDVSYRTWLEPKEIP